jgi:hypothetical protein
MADDIAERFDQQDALLKEILARLPAPGAAKELDHRASFGRFCVCGKKARFLKGLEYRCDEHADG